MNKPYSIKNSFYKREGRIEGTYSWAAPVDLLWLATTVTAATCQMSDWKKRAEFSQMEKMDQIKGKRLALTGSDTENKGSGRGIC